MFSINLQPGEKMLDMHRQTEIVLVKSVLLVFILIYFPLYFLIDRELIADYKAATAIWSLLVLAYFGRNYMLWLLNVSILTDRRLIKVAYRGLFSKAVYETPLDRISNVSYHSRGLLASLFATGTVKVEVLGLSQPIELEKVRHASRIKDDLWKAHRASLELQSSAKTVEDHNNRFSPFKKAKIV